jgi:stage II sporulation protein D
MKKLKSTVALAAVLFVVTLIIPTLVVLPFVEKVSGKLGEELKAEEKVTEVNTQTIPTVEVAVYRTAKKEMAKLPLEDYIVGVVASEMSAYFELEALKAQALAARTYIVKQLMSEEKLGAPEGSDVTDTENHQVYKSDDELRKLWGVDYKWKMEKIHKAVQETEGLILTYKGAPINATFFSTSNGYTESSEEIWPNALPYLKSVKSSWDLKSPKFKGQIVMSVSDFEKKLGVKLKDSTTIGKVTARTTGNRVGKVDINGTVLTGREIREKLGLKSTDFTWERKGDNIVINTKGYGHGVGMSQYGANGMAMEGKTSEDIVKYYYKGIEVSSSENFLTKIMAKK